MLTQRLANRFPSWTRLRVDPSSMGWRFLSAFADAFQELYLERVKMAEEGNLLRRWLPQESIWWIELEEADQIEQEINLNGTVNYIYPTSVVGDTVTLTRDQDITEMLGGTPTRIELAFAGEVDPQYPDNGLVVWESTAPSIYNQLILPAQLTVEVSGSVNYFRSNGRRDRFASNKYFCKITGTDINYLPCEETVTVQDDGIYQTHNIFRTVTAVETDGFDGAVTIYLGWSSALSFKTDPYRTLITTETEGQVRVRRLDVSGDIFLQFYTNQIKQGPQYRNGQVVSDNEDILFDLYCGGGVVDFAFGPHDGRLYVVDDAYNLYCYHSYAELAWTPPTATVTRDNYIVVLATSQFARAERTEPLWTWFRQPKYPILTVQIKRISPSGGIEYLDVDNTWVVGVINRTGNQLGNLPEQTWQDIRFETVYNEAGIWEYVCTVTTTQDTTVSVIQVMVLADFNLPRTLLATLDTTTDLWFDQDGRLTTWDGTDLMKFSLHRDSYIGDPGVQRLLFREIYDEVVITP